MDAPPSEPASLVEAGLGPSRGDRARSELEHGTLGRSTPGRQLEQDALAQVDAWMESPSLVVLSEAPGYWERLSETLRASGVTGPQVHDARVAAMCLHHGVTELWTADRDFGRFPSLKVRNPLV